MALKRRLREGARLLAGLPLVAREQHPFANDRASHIRLRHGGLQPFNPGRETPVSKLRAPAAAIRYASTRARALGYFLQRIGLLPPRGQRAAAFMHGALLDDEAAFLDRGAKSLVGCGLVRIDPHHQHTAR